MGAEAGHGGKRPGAGRKPVHPEGKTISVGATVPEELIAKLGAISEQEGWTRSEAVAPFFGGLLPGGLLSLDPSHPKMTRLHSANSQQRLLEKFFAVPRKEVIGQ